MFASLGNSLGYLAWRYRITRLSTVVETDNTALGCHVQPQ
jgi:hypothetical protein